MFEIGMHRYETVRIFDRPRVEVRFFRIDSAKTSSQDFKCLYRAVEDFVSVSFEVQQAHRGFGSGLLLEMVDSRQPSQVVKDIKRATQRLPGKRMRRS